MLKKTALVALMSGILAAPLAWAQEDFDNEVDASDAAEFSDETAADESFDEQAEPDESTGMADADDSADEEFVAEGADESAADVQEAEEPPDDVAAELDDEGNPADEPGSDADSEEAASDLIDDTGTVDTAGDPEAPDAQSDTRAANTATSPAAETPAAVTRDDARGISITLKHSGAYIARYEISYSEAGEEKKIEAREKTKGWTQTFVVPAGGTNIRLQAWAMTGLVWQPWGEIYNMVLQPRTDYCYENTGTTLGRAFNPC
jgi:hypothetical protein